MRERPMRSRDPANRAHRRPTIASCASTSQPTLALAWRTSSQILYRCNSAASDVDLARFDLRIIRAMQSSVRPRHDG
jgi:hypothetical protein